MSKAELSQFLSNIPRYCAVFTMARVPEWMAKRGIARGQEMRIYPGERDTAYYCLNGRTTSFIFPTSTLKFVRYERFDIRLGSYVPIG